ncbi:histone deacetylase family protein [Candidatus Palauibacter sp.]|uniref:histone deacetylase family protein n=1 Tax=Candidatus Palauibacter sp. TaxID=3101350 RepID=UPI003CC68137
MRVNYSPGYTVPLPDGHAFLMGKFAALREILERDGLISPADVVEPGEASWEELALVHTPAYLYKLRHGTLDRAEVRRLGLPWSPALVRRSRLAVRGTVNAAWMALEDGVAANLAGGTHHAFPDHGEGFCVLNDVGVAVRMLRRGGWIRRVLVVDLDVHQGNGTAAVFAADPDTFTFSMHGEGNYPFRETPSDLDMGLPDGTGNEEYEEALLRFFPEALARLRPDLVFYLGGIDVLAGDRFGRLALTRAGLERRDRIVIGTIRGEGLPLALLLSGGYAATPELTAELHAVAHRTAREIESAA